MKHTLHFSLAGALLFFQLNASAQCSGTQTFNYTGANQSFVVPAGITSITVECYGAKGGNGNQASSPGGAGAYVAGEITVVPGETLTIIAGGMGENGTTMLDGGGGGGGSFVIRTSDNSPLMIAGGGGGGSYQASTPGAGGTNTTTGSAGGYVPTLPGMGGFSDNGGGGGTGAGGGGWNANGTSNNWATGGIMKGGAGGVSLHVDGDGGFGGGGAAYHGGGGGGGYSGGGGGTYTIGGGGGASYNTGASQTNTAGVNTGNGYVVFTYGISYFTSASATICYGADYTFPDGSTQTNITAQVVQTSSITAVVNGCDSTVETTVDVYAQIDNGAVQSGLTMTADATSGTFQWVDCNNAFAEISGATNQAYTATADGSYAVVVSENGCSDTSSCFTVLYFGIDDENDFDFSVVPNPANDQITVSYPNTLTGGYGEIISITGEVALRTPMSAMSQTTIDISTLSPGIYFVKIISTDGSNSAAQKLIIR